VLDARVDLFLDEVFLLQVFLFSTIFFMVEHDLCFTISFSLDSLFLGPLVFFFCLFPLPSFYKYESVGGC
jgi:hypothetical protein